MEEPPTRPAPPINDGKAATADSLLASLAGLSAPLAFLGDDGRLLFQNDSAAELLARDDPPDWPAMLERWQNAVRTPDGPQPQLTAATGAWSARLLDLSAGADREPPSAPALYLVILTEGPLPAAAPPDRGLTQAELAVLEHLVAGLTPAEITGRQQVSLATVRTHIARLHEKFGVNRTLDVVRIAISEGLGLPRR